MKERRPGWMISLGLLVFVLVGCSGRSNKAAPATAPTTHTVTISQFKYEPETLTVHEGDTVEWKNNDDVPHTATSVDEKTFDSGVFRAGASWKWVADKKGSFDYICTRHPNMKAKLIVQ